MQLPLLLALGTMASYWALLKNPSFKFWPQLCPLCGAAGCARFLGFYIRVRLYCQGKIYHNIAIARFICLRLNPEMPPGTHRTFSLLHDFLIPYFPYALDLTMVIAENLVKHAANVYQTTNLLQEIADDHLNLYAATITRIKHRLDNVIAKLNQLPSRLAEAMGWSKHTKGLSELLAFLKNYHSRLHAALSGARALAYDWFYLAQQGLRYMQRSFLFGTASQQRV